MRREKTKRVDSKWHKWWEKEIHYYFEWQATENDINVNEFVVYITIFTLDGVFHRFQRASSVVVKITTVSVPNSIIKKTNINDKFFSFSVCLFVCPYLFHVTSTQYSSSMALHYAKKRFQCFIAIVEKCSQYFSTWDLYKTPLLTFIQPFFGENFAMKKSSNKICDDVENYFASDSMRIT